MLQAIREHTQGWIAGIIISIIILTFALWGIHSYFVGGGPNNVIAKVNGVEITKEQLNTAYERLRRQVQSQRTATNILTMENEKSLKNSALRSLIEIEVLKQASFKQGFTISDRQIDTYLQSIPEFQVNGQFSVERFQEILSHALLSMSEFLDLLKTSLLIDQPKQGIFFTSFSLPGEIDYAISLVNQERDVDYIQIPLQYFLSKPINISKDSISAYFNQHKSEFMTPEKVSVDYIELSLSDVLSVVPVSESELKNFYNENINIFTQPAQWKLEDILIPLTTNANPQAIAKAQQTAESMLASASKGGDFSKLALAHPGTFNGKTWVKLNQLPAELQKAVANITKPGQLSDIINTTKGFVIVKVIDIKKPEIQPYEQVKDKVKTLYARQHGEEKFAELRDKMADLTYEHPESLGPAAQRLNLQIKTSELFTKDQAGKDIAASNKVRHAAFSSDVLKLQNNSEVIQIDPEHAVVIHVKTHEPATLLPLNSVSKKIENQLRTKEAEIKTEQLAHEIQNKLQKPGADTQQLANAYNLAWNKVGFIGRYSNKVDSAILDMAFRLPQPTAGKVIYGTVRLPNGYAVIALNAVKQGKEDPSQQNVFAEQVQNSEGALEYELYKQSMIRNAKVKID